MDRTSRPLPEYAAEPLVPARSHAGPQDLLSLPVLRALLQERSVTRAAKAVGLTQPAVSNALGRLRRRFGDDLLVKVGREYRLTPLGQSLLDRVDTAFDAVERLFEKEFDPASSTRIFTLILSDYSVVLLAEPITQTLRAEAPGVRLNLQQLSASSLDFQESLRHSDGLVIPPGYIRDNPSTRLLSDRWVCIVSGNNLRVEDTVTLDDLARLPLVASYDQLALSSSPPVRQLRALGVEPHVEITVESFLAVPFLVAGTDRIAFVQEKLARRFSGLVDVRVLPSPLPNLEHLVSLHWDAIETNDPGHRWFREALGRAAATITDAEQSEQPGPFDT